MYLRFLGEIFLIYFTALSLLTKFNAILKQLLHVVGIDDGLIWRQTDFR
jgi:hypothetical protein